MSETLSGLYLLVGLFLVVLAILWFLLPFAIFGTKDKLDQVIREIQETNELLRKLRARATISERSGSDPPATQSETECTNPPEKGKPWEHA